MTDIVPDRRPGPARLAALTVVLLVVSWGLAAVSAWPWVATPRGAALLRVSLRAVTALTAPATPPREVTNLPVHMRPPAGATPTTGRRSDAVVTVAIDGVTVLVRTYRPTGLRRDGPVYAYEEIRVPPGRHVVQATLAAAGAAAGARTWSALSAKTVGPEEAPLLEFRDGAWRWD